MRPSDRHRGDRREAREHPAGGPAVVGTSTTSSSSRCTSTITLDREADGTARLTAVETLVAVFPAIDQNRGIVRDIPAEYQRVDIGLQVVSVTDENGGPVVYQRSTFTDYDGIDFVSLSIDDDTFKHGRTTYVITWTARDVVGTFADTSTQEFFWDVNGTAWRQGFGSVTADLHLGAGLSDHLTGRTACYFGYENSTDRCELRADRRRLHDGCRPAVLVSERHDRRGLRTRHLPPRHPGRQDLARRRGALGAARCAARGGDARRSCSAVCCGPTHRVAASSCRSTRVPRSSA